MKINNLYHTSCCWCRWYCWCSVVVTDFFWLLSHFIYLFFWFSPPCFSLFLSFFFSSSNSYLLFTLLIRLRSLSTLDFFGDPGLVNCNKKKLNVFWLSICPIYIYIYICPLLNHCTSVHTTIYIVFQGQ